jgi:drug/metabolite transporter (DMT)-like permease
MKYIAYISFTLLALIWGISFIFTKWAIELISPAQIVLLRVLFGFVPILIFALASKVLSWTHIRHVLHFLVLGLLVTPIYYCAYAFGISMLYSGVAGVLSGAIPVFSFICASIFLREEKIALSSVFGVSLGFIGVLLIAQPWSSGPDEVSMVGVGYMLAGSLALGASFVYTRKFISPLNISSASLATYQTGIALIALIILVDMDGITAILSDATTFWGVVLGLGLLGTGVAFILYYIIVRHLGVLAASSVTYIPPVIALIIGWQFAGEPLTVIDVLALCSILGGIYLSQKKPKAHQGSLGTFKGNPELVTLKD